MNAPRVVESEVRVRYAETDAQGVVYYANYFVYMEVGRANYFRTLGFDPTQHEHSGRGIVITEATCRYHAPARFDDRLIVRAWVENVRRSNFTFVYEIVHGDDRRLIAKGRTVQVFVDLHAMRPIRLPPETRDVLRAAAAPSSQ
jgi:acyl-CoA thioester hydrolase